MNKIILGILVFSFSSHIFAETKASKESQLKIIKEQTTSLNKCSGLAMINPESILSSKENLDSCKIPNYVFSQLNIFSKTVIDRDDFLQLISASAVAKGIVVRNQNDRGFPVDNDDRAKYYNAPYDVVTTKQMPVVLCAYLTDLFKKSPQFFDKAPTCDKVRKVVTN